MVPRNFFCLVGSNTMGFRTSVNSDWLLHLCVLCTTALSLDVNPLACTDIRIHRCTTGTLCEVKTLRVFLRGPERPSDPDTRAYPPDMVLQGMVHYYRSVLYPPQPTAFPKNDVLQTGRSVYHPGRAAHLALPALRHWPPAFWTAGPER